MDERLVYDVGAYNGDDTAYYLLRGYRVVSIEADPALVEKLQSRFAAETAAGRCTILNVGVAEKDGHAPFYLSQLPIWNSFDKAMATRESYTAREIQIQCRTFQSIMKEYGVPYFLKVDIEGLDHLCVLALQREDRPAYVSFEGSDDAPELVRYLNGLDYRRFRLVNQRGWQIVMIPEAGSAHHVVWSVRQWIRLMLRKHQAVHGLLKSTRARVPAIKRHVHAPSTAGGSSYKFPPGSSGPIPSEVPGPWLTADEFQHTFISVKTSGIFGSSWFDVHAALA
jgi:FkbM family methyltransferase